MRNKRGKGLFITFEGIDGAGKTTQARALAERLNQEGFQAVFVESHGNSILADRIRDLVQDPGIPHITPEVELLLFTARYLQRMNELILPKLNNNKIVIVDRHLDGNYVYQHYGRGLDLHVVERVCTLVNGGLCPNMTILLDISADIAFKRIRNNKLDRIELEGPDFLDKVRLGYLKRAKDCSNRWITVNGNQSIEETHLAVLRKVMDRLI